MHDQPETLWGRLNDSMARLASLQERRLDPAVLNERLAARSRALQARMSGASVEPNMMVLGYNKGGARFGIPIDDVLEVQALDFVTVAPRAPAFILGVIHWRGAILSLIDVGRLMGIAESGLADIHVSIVIEAAGKRLAVAALEAEDILAVPVSRVQAAPELPRGIPNEWVVGACEERLILKMDAIVQDARLTRFQ